MQMYILSSTQNKEEICRLSMKYTGAVPKDFAEIAPKSAFAVTARCEEGTVGAGCGYYQQMTKEFFIGFFYLEKKDRTVALLRQLISRLICEADAAYEITCFIWKYEIPDQKTDVFLKILKGIPGLEVKDSTYAKEVRIDFQNFADMHHNADTFSTRFLHEKGLYLVLWENCGGEIKKQFRQIRESADDELRKLLPLEEDTYDSRTSVVVLAGEKKEVCSWMLCQKRSEEEVEIRRYYTMKQYRSAGIGIYFGGYMMQQLAAHYRYVSYTMWKDNEAMLYFTKRYFRDMKICETSKKYLAITAKK